MYPLGENSLVMQLGLHINEETHRLVQALAAHLDRHPVPGMIEYVPAFTSVTVYYDLGHAALEGEASGLSPYEVMSDYLFKAAAEAGERFDAPSAVVEIPVCYGGDFGPDLDFVAEHNRLTPEEVIEIHSSGEYRTYMIGFAPGFPYLGGLSDKIAAPRRETPRLKIAAGTVGIAGLQTGVYPLESPGGWQLIGRCPLPLFRPDQWPPTYIQMGNIVKFKAITREQYERLRGAEE
ncbi:5-oxoprolinase subunit PxpB [Paenibacillaceae bacterium WGS1546]|uniref:5-oxoprolinase subunit PxpB n=1 Tax=Cohnella sp. WGS1546 TaxID=3366810 RepID=UPI00372D87E3